MRITQTVNSLSFDEALFLIGCTLCQQGKDDEGMSVIVMYALGNGDAQYHEDARLEVIKQRELYLATLRKKNILYEIIADKWDSKTIAKYGKRSQGRYYSLRELSKGAFNSSESLYAACVANYMSVTGKDLMLLFLNTHVTYEYMSRRINHVANNRISEDVVQAAYQDFVTYYSVRSLRSYKAETGNPLGALAFTFNDFYLKSSFDPSKPEANFFDIINAVGVMAENEDGLRPHLDTAKVTQATTGKGLDFNDAVNKIYKVSALLYQINARNGSYIYYDLFSRYRDVVNKEAIKDMRADIRAVCDFWDFEIEDSIEYRESKDSISQYSADRKAVTLKLMDLIDNNIPDQQMFDYFKDLVNTDLKIGKNGSKGFANLTFSKSSKSKLGLSYDGQIQVAIEGALALKQLLQYASSRGIDINQIDNAIFRNKSLHTTCTTLENYILLQNDLKTLIKDIPDNESSVFKSNDAIAKHLNDLKDIEDAVAAGDSKKRTGYKDRLERLQKLKFVPFVSRLSAADLIVQLNASILALNNEPCGYEYLCSLVTYINCNVAIAAVSGCKYYDYNSDKLSDTGIVEFTSAALSRIESIAVLGEKNLEAMNKLSDVFKITDERTLLSVGALAETFLTRIAGYVHESDSYYGEYIMSLLDKKYELWMNINLDTFDTLYLELLDCSRQYQCNYTLDKEIEYKEELKSAFGSLMEACNLIVKTPVYAQRKLISIPSKELIKANQAILMTCNTGLSKLAKNQLRNMCSFNSVNFAYKNGVLLEYNKCYVHRNGYLYNKVTHEISEITLNDLVLISKVVR